MPRRLRFSLAASELHPRLSLHQEGRCCLLQPPDLGGLGTKPGRSRRSRQQGQCAAGNPLVAGHQAATRVTAQQLTFRIGRRGGGLDTLAGVRAPQTPPHPNPHHRQLAGVGLGRSTGRAWRKAQPRATGEFYYCGWRSRLPGDPRQRSSPPRRARRSLVRPGAKTLKAYKEGFQAHEFADGLDRPLSY